jgi:putative endonuclease
MKHSTRDHGGKRRSEAANFNCYRLSFRGAPAARTRNLERFGDRVAYYVYLLASRKNGVLYLGVTNDLVRRVYQHKTKAVRGFSARYGVDRLVWFEIYDDPSTAITREKELKKWRRAWKVSLIEAANPEWEDLYQTITR